MKVNIVFLVLACVLMLVQDALSVDCGVYTTQVGSTGPGYETPVTSSPDPGYPDFIVPSVKLMTESGVEKYNWGQEETIKMHSWTENIGDADWQGSANEIQGRFYLSKGYKEDAHSDWIWVGTDFTNKSNLELGDSPHHEEEGLIIQNYINSGDIEPGKTYNIVYCADRTVNQANGDGEVMEKHKSNNCSTEAVFSVAPDELASVPPQVPPANEDLFPVIMMIIE